MRPSGRESPIPSAGAYAENRTSVHPFPRGRDEILLPVVPSLLRRHPLEQGRLSHASEVVDADSEEIPTGAGIRAIGEEDPATPSGATVHGGDRDGGRRLCRPPGRRAVARFRDDKTPIGAEDDPVDEGYVASVLVECDAVRVV